MSLILLLFSNSLVLVLHSMSAISFHRFLSLSVTATSPWSPFHGPLSLTITSYLSNSPAVAINCWTLQGLTVHGAPFHCSSFSSFSTQLNLRDHLLASLLYLLLLHCSQHSAYSVPALPGEKHTVLITDLALSVWTETSCRLLVLLVTILFFPGQFFFPPSWFTPCPLEPPTLNSSSIRNSQLMILLPASLSKYKQLEEKFQRHRPPFLSNTCTNIVLPST